MSAWVHRLSPPALAQRVIAVATVSAALVLLSVAPAGASISAEQQGAALLTQIQKGQTSCGKLSSSNLVLMGEYSMGRIMGSPAAQNAMNAQMLAILGAGGEQLAYRFMGERLGGCATGNGPVPFGTMMGIMGTSEMGASYGSAYPAGGYRSSMMSGYGPDQAAPNGGMSVIMIVLIVLGALVLLAMIFLLATRRPPRRSTQPRAA